MSSTCNAAADLFVVIRDVSAASTVPSHQKYQVFGLNWTQLEPAAEWASGQGAELGKFVAIQLTDPKFLAPEITLPVADPTKPYVKVLEDESGLEAIGTFDSREYGVCWCRRFFGRKSRGDEHLYEILDPRLWDPRSEKWEVVDHVPSRSVNRGRNWAG